MDHEQLTQVAIDALAVKLDRLGDDLTVTERAVLLGVFARAKASLAHDATTASQGGGDAVASYAVALPEAGPQETLADGFRNVFATGSAGGIGDDEVTGYLRPVPTVVIGSPYGVH